MEFLVVMILLKSLSLFNTHSVALVPSTKLKFEHTIASFMKCDNNVSVSTQNIAQTPCLCSFILNKDGPNWPYEPSVTVIFLQNLTLLRNYCLLLFCMQPSKPPPFQTLLKSAKSRTLLWLQQWNIESNNFQSLYGSPDRKKKRSMSCRTLRHYSNQRLQSIKLSNTLTYQPSSTTTTKCLLPTTLLRFQIN